MVQRRASRECKSVNVFATFATAVNILRSNDSSCETSLNENQIMETDENLPRVLLLKPLPDFVIFGEDCFPSSKFRFLKAWESPLPLDQFLRTYAQSVSVLLTSTLSPVTADTLRLMPAVKLVLTTSTGIEHIDLAECRRRGITVANAGTIASQDVADMAVGLLIDVLRNVSAADRYVRQGLWPTKGDYPLGFKLGGKRVGIVGLGRIGSLVAKRLDAFGCHISYNSRKKKPSVNYPFYSNIHELAADSDILIICCGLTDETHHMVNADVLAALGKEGVIINIGRGAIIYEKELVRCLVQGEIKGAGLDVFENGYDVPKELLVLNNVVLSPHSATLTVENFQDRRKVVVGNLEAFFSDKPILTPFLDY